MPKGALRFRCGPGLAKAGDPGDVVDMSVCQQDCDGRLLQVRQLFHDAPRTETGINDETLLRSWQGDDQGVLLEGKSHHD
jgi:hypothetical protein